MDFSVIVPFHNCQNTLIELCRRLKSSCDSISRSHELIFVVDGIESKIDQSEQKYISDMGITLIQLVRNFGQHAAIRAGLTYSSGEIVAVMDCDLQDPPEMLIKMFEEIQKGYDVVQTKRLGKYDSRYRRVSRKLANFAIKFAYPKNFDLDISSFVMMRREVVSAILNSKGHDHLGLILNWMKYPTSTLQYIRSERVVGKSSYSFKKLTNHAIEAASFDFTHLFQRLTKVSVIFIFISMFTTIFSLIQSLFFKTVPGWTSVIALITLGTSIMLTILSLLGIALSQYINNSQRPQFIVHERSRRNG